jgi:hypothetical protein
MPRARVAILVCSLGLALVGAWKLFRPERKRLMSDITKPTYTIDQRLAEFGPDARKRWQPYFDRAGLSYPPKRLVFLGLKLERQLNIYAAGPDDRLKFLRTIPVQGASGHLGPKLREGDKQVPEGCYEIEYLEPNSRHDVSIKLNYPNGFDLARAAEEGRTEPGSFIMIHGGDTSIGCLAIGDDPSIDLWVLSADAGIKNVRVIMAPVDFRRRELPPDRPPAPAWIGRVYDELRAELAKLPN